LYLKFKYEKTTALTWRLWWWSNRPKEFQRNILWWWNTKVHWPENWSPFRILWSL